MVRLLLLCEAIDLMVIGYIGGGVVSVSGVVGDGFVCLGCPWLVGRGLRRGLKRGWKGTGEVLCRGTILPWGVKTEEKE